MGVRMLLRPLTPDGTAARSRQRDCERNSPSTRRDDGVLSRGRRINNEWRSPALYSFLIGSGGNCNFMFPRRCRPVGSMRAVSHRKGEEVKRFPGGVSRSAVADAEFVIVAALLFQPVFLYVGVGLAGVVGLSRLLLSWAD